jgi:glycosyltransferase involved in cell wall biosynthesis
VRIALLAHLHHPISAPYAGGVEMHTDLVARHLVERGHEVTVFAKEGSRTAGTVVPLVPAAFDPAAAHRRQPGSAAPVLRTAMAAACLQVLSGGFDVVLNNTLSPIPLQLLRDVPMVTVLHTPATLEEVLEVVEAPGWAAPRHHRWVSVSAANALAWQHRLPPITVVHNGIDLEHWSSAERPVPGLAVWTGRITEEKGLHVAIEAARLAGFELHFAGPLADPDYYHRTVEPLLGADTVYHGHLDHDRLPDFLAAGEVFVASPLWAEPFGLSIVEAMAVGTPIAATLTGALGEIVGPRAGDLSVHHSARTLKDSIHRARSKDRGQVRAWSRRFSADRMVETYLDLLGDTAERAGTRGPVPADPEGGIPADCPPGTAL